MSNIDLSFEELGAGRIEWHRTIEQIEAHLKAEWELEDFKVLKEAVAAYAPKEDWLSGFSDAFNKHVQKLDAKLRGRILTYIMEVIKTPVTPRGDTIKPLEGDKKGLWRYREGDYRIVYYPDKEKNKVTFMDVDSRGEIYK
jgi:mRNA-degrading endonuclease RelE of RelBE toxin-antitoxin system